MDEFLKLNGSKNSKLNIGFIDGFMTKFLIFSGIWNSKEDHRRSLTKALFNLAVLTLGFFSISYMFILKYEDIDINTEILLHWVEIFHAICAQSLFITKYQLISRLAEDINTALEEIKLPVYDEEKYLTVLHLERASFWKIIRIASSAIVGVYMSIACDTSFLLVRGIMKLPYPSWFPFYTDDEHVILYFLATVFESLIYVEMLCIDIAMFGLWFATVNKASALLTILGLSFQKLTEERENICNSRYQSEGFQENIKNCVDLHNHIKDLVKDLNSSMGLIFIEVVLTSQIAICFCGYQVIRGASTDDKLRLFRYASGVGVFTLMLLLYCISGQKLKNKSEELFISLYDSQWYQQSLARQHLFYICQTNSKKPLVILGAQIAPADMHTFMASIRTVFSYLNFLLAMRKTHEHEEICFLNRHDMFINNVN